MRWSVICFNGEAPFSSRYGLPIVIRHSLTAPREALSLQILASLHLLLIVCLSGYLREKCTHLRKKKKKLTQFLIQQRKKVCHFLIVYRLWRQRDYLEKITRGDVGGDGGDGGGITWKKEKQKKTDLIFFFSSVKTNEIQQLPILFLNLYNLAYCQISGGGIKTQVRMTTSIIQEDVKGNMQDTCDKWPGIIARTIRF